LVTPNRRRRDREQSRGFGLIVFPEGRGVSPLEPGLSCALEQGPDEQNYRLWFFERASEPTNSDRRRLRQ